MRAGRVLAALNAVVFYCCWGVVAGYNLQRPLISSDEFQHDVIADLFVWDWGTRLDFTVPRLWSEVDVKLLQVDNVEVWDLKLDRVVDDTGMTFRYDATFPLVKLHRDLPLVFYLQIIHHGRPEERFQSRPFTIGNIPHLQARADPSLAGQKGLRVIQDTTLVVSTTSSEESQSTASSADQDEGQQSFSPTSQSASSATTTSHLSFTPGPTPMPLPDEGNAGEPASSISSEKPMAQVTKTTFITSAVTKTKLDGAKATATAPIETPVQNIYQNNTSGLSTAAKAGIGLGVSIAGICFVGLIAAFVVFQRRVTRLLPDAVKAKEYDDCSDTSSVRSWSSKKSTLDVKYNSHEKDVPTPELSDKLGASPKELQAQFAETLVASPKELQTARFSGVSKKCELP